MIIWSTFSFVLRKFQLPNIYDTFKTDIPLRFNWKSTWFRGFLCKFWYTHTLLIPDLLSSPWHLAAGAKFIYEMKNNVWEVLPSQFCNKTRSFKCYQRGGGWKGPDVIFRHKTMGNFDHALLDARVYLLENCEWSVV